MSDTAKRKQSAWTRLNAAQKLEIIERFEKPNPPSKRGLAREYNVCESTVRHILSNAEATKKKILNMDTNKRNQTFRNVQPKYPEVEESLFNWIENSRRSNIELTPNIILAQAKKIAIEMGKPHDDFKASWGWYQRFKTRRGLSPVLPDEVNNSEISIPQVPAPLDDFYHIVTQYNPEDIYGLSESGLFNCLLPRYSAFFPDEDVSTMSGKKKLYNRVTLMICCNSTGTDKVPTALISKARSPACANGKRWPTPYLQQDSALMDIATFDNWFVDVFFSHVRKKTKNKVLLLLYNTFQYHEIEKFDIRVVFIPASEPSLKNPMDMGIIDSFKKDYKYRLMKDIIEYHNSPHEVKEHLKELASKKKRGSTGIQYGKPAHLIDTANYCVAVWSNLSQEFLKKSFQKSNIIPQFKTINCHEIESNYEEIEKEDTRLMEKLYEMFQNCYLPNPVYQDRSIVLSEIKKFIHLDDKISEFYQQCIKEEMELASKNQKNN